MNDKLIEERARGNRQRDECSKGGPPMSAAHYAQTLRDHRLMLAGKCADKHSGACMYVAKKMAFGR